jgi:hypothetical protein
MRTLFAFVLLGLVATLVSADHIVQVWFCLERCGYDKADALSQLQILQTYNKTITHVALEMWDLGDNGTIIDNGFTDIVAEVKAAGFVPVAMVTTVNLDFMVNMFANPYDFISNLQTMTIAAGFHGVDFDFEPSAAATEYQAAQYALFLSHITRNFNAQGLSVAADIATWNTIWDFSLLGLTVTNMLTTMNTYGTDYSGFVSAYQANAQYLKPYQMVVGMESDSGIDADGVADRFQFLQQNGACRVSVWQSPMPDYWWPHLVALSQRC